MESIHGWVWVLLAFAVYIAVVALVRLMLRRRDRITADIRQQLEAQQRQKPRKASPKDKAA